MKIKYLKLKSWLLALFGGMLGLSACCCMYGTPSATYHMKGTVTNEEGNPIAGIGVGSYRDWTNDADTSTGVKYHDTTDVQGHYNLDLDYYMPGENISLDFRDIDGELNGSYLDTVMTIPTGNVHLSGGHGQWDEGEGTVTTDVVMRSK